LAFADDIIEAAEDDDYSRAMLNFEEEDFEEAKKYVANPENFIQLPDSYELKKYSIMEYFCDAIKDENIRRESLMTIRGKGAFRRFKDLMIYHGLIEDWYKYERQEITERVQAWCEDNDVQFDY
jgi:hypothetical protein